MAQISPSAQAGDPTKDGQVSAWITEDPDGQVRVGVNVSLATGVTAKISIDDWRLVCEQVENYITETQARRVPG